MEREADVSFSPEKLDSLLSGKESLEQVLLRQAVRTLRLPPSAKRRCIIRKKSIDARKKDAIKICFRVLVTDEEKAAISNPNETVVVSRKAPGTTGRRRPVVVGFGPGGMMSALLLARSGLCPIVLERGSAIEKRTAEVATYFSSGKVNPITNIQFGEGGAGTFSDGKLNTGVNDPRREFVLRTFVEAGAPEEILYMTRPHVGTDRLQSVVYSIRTEIEKLGGTILFERTFTALCKENGRVTGVRHAASAAPADVDTIETDSVILALGHSARDTFRSLYDAGICFEAKPISVGVRIEHSQAWLDEVQYGKYAGHRFIPRAEYKLVAHTSNGRALYTFCMCPGGFVVPSASDNNEIVTNGMSYYDRGGENANSAILVGVNPEDYASGHPLAGIEYQEKLERAAYQLGGSEGCAPGQTVEDFLEKRGSVYCSSVKPTYKPGITYANLHDIMPDYVSDTIWEGLHLMDKKLKGFARGDAFLTGMETRSSSPVRILRDESLASVSVKGVYPCGEGAGYAGGIMSSAIDGLRCAEALLQSVSAM